jgi:hypothetical protein
MGTSELRRPQYVAYASVHSNFGTVDVAAEASKVSGD